MMLSPFSTSMDYLRVLKESSDWFNSIALVITIVVLIVSIWLTFRTLFNIRQTPDVNIHRPICADTNTPDVSSARPVCAVSAFEAAGHDGDDELDGEDDIPLKDGTFFSRSRSKLISNIFPKYMVVFL